jgi:hypothetical protein
MLSHNLCVNVSVYLLVPPQSNTPTLLPHILYLLDLTVIPCLDPTTLSLAYSHTE